MITAITTKVYVQSLSIYFELMLSVLTELLILITLTPSASTLQAGCQDHRPAVLSGHTPLDRLCSRPIV